MAACIRRVKSLWIEIAQRDVCEGAWWTQMTVSWPHAQQMFHKTGLKQKSEVKKSLWRVLLSPLAMWTEKQPIILSLIINICVVGEGGSPGGTFPLQCRKEKM